MTGRTSAASSPSTKRYLLDRRVRRYGSGRLLLGGEPARLFRLSGRGAIALDRLITTGEAPAGEMPAGEMPDDEARDDETVVLVQRLVRAGVLHPLPDPGTRPSLLEITVVVPVRDPPASFGALLSALRRSGAREVVVVDDGSADGGAASAAAAEREGAKVIGRLTSGGPASARNAASPTSTLVAYLDADTVLDEADPGEWLRRCAAHFADESLAIVAPRIASTPSGAGAGKRAGPEPWIEAYEELESPLDLGRHPGLVGKGRRLSYVPAAGLVARMAALDEVGGFDDALRFGEDVDLLRRLESAGWLVRYEPASVVGHRPRPDLASFARQRVAYGSAAAPIERRHPGTVAPYVGTPASTLSGAALIAWWLWRRRARQAARVALVGATIGTVFPVRSLARRLGQAECPHPVRLASELSVRSTLWGTAGLLAALRRAWWPLALAGCVVKRTRRATFVLLATAVAAGHGPPAIRGALREPAPSSGIARLWHHLMLGVVDDASYGAGVLLGCWRERSGRALAGQVKRAPKDPPAD